ncbi:MAG: FkbM family methyltransferase [Rhodospirillaceae bacterium]|nr:FkbM family methyltransferase [Rhodospirillaceae bacterium]
MTDPSPIDTRRTLSVPGIGDPTLVLTPTRQGLYLCNRFDILGFALIEHGEWAEPEVAVVTALLRPGDVVIECGAHIGTLTIPMARAIAPGGAVHAFEAQPYFARLLDANLALNGMADVVMRNVVVSGASGTIRLPPVTYDKSVNYAGLSFASLPTDGSGVGKPIPMRTLDQICARFDRLNLIKLDIEDMEPAALAGAATLFDRFRPIVYCKIRRPTAFAQVRDFLTTRGYRLYWHIFPHYRADNYRGNPVNRFGVQGDVNLLALPPGKNSASPGLPPATDFAEVERISPGILGPATSPR